MGTTPVRLIAAETGFTFVQVLTTIQIQKQTVAYSGWSHLQIGDSATVNFGLIESAAVGGNLQANRLYTFSNYMNHPPSRFGGSYVSARDMFIYFNTDPSAGDGDLTVTVYYLKIADI
jgi:hypothetical protein